MNDYSAPDESIRVTKRDGSVEPFVLAKLLHSIRCGLMMANETQDLDTSTAGNLGEAVYEYLKATYGDSRVSARQLAELVELVLTQTGHNGAAMAIREHHRFREKLRRSVMVASTRPGDGRYIQHRWNKTLVLQHLRRRHGLESPSARMIAGRVEELVFSCGLRVVTCGLVREMVKSELLAWGLLSGALVVKRSRPHREMRKVRGNSDSAP
jgi:hypothetical protein